MERRVVRRGVEHASPVFVDEGSQKSHSLTVTHAADSAYARLKAVENGLCLLEDPSSGCRHAACSTTM
jgi:hypothetical protein